MSHRVVLYTKEGCCLCDRAKQVLDRLKEEFALDIEEVDIAEDPALLERYGYVIPVVVIDGKLTLESKITEFYLRKALASAQPESKHWPWHRWSRRS